MVFGRFAGLGWDGFVRVWLGLLGVVVGPASWLLVLCCFAGYAALTLLGGFDYAIGLGSRDLMLSYYERHGLVPVDLEFLAGRRWLGMFTGMFLHIGPFHLLVNLVCLRCFGRFAESISVSGVVIPVFVFCGVMGGLFHVMAYPNSHVSVVGASGAVSGLLGFNLLLMGWSWGPVARFGIGRYHVSSAWLVGLWFAQQGIYLVLASISELDLSGTALVLHMGGFLAGLLAGWLLRLVGLVR